MISCQQFGGKCCCDFVCYVTSRKGFLEVKKIKTAGGVLRRTFGDFVFLQFETN